MFSGQAVMQNPDKDGRESDNKMLACGYYFSEIKMYITYLYKTPATFLALSVQIYSVYHDHTIFWGGITL